MGRIGRWFRFERVLFALGTASLAYGAWHAWDAWSQIAPTRSWVETRGVVVESNVGHERSSPARGGRGYRSVPEIRYRYTVGGAELTGDRLYPGTPLDWRDDEQVAAFLADYPAGAPITVHHDPANPRTAALFLEISYAIAWLYAGLGVVALFIGWAMWRWPSPES